MTALTLTFPCEITIDVTQKDIDNGRQHHCTGCPISRAMKRATDAPFCSTHKAYLALRNAPGQSIAEARTPKVAANFIQMFDDHGKDAVRPFSFTAEFTAVQQ